jgi:hypothetical protein
VGVLYYLALVLGLFGGCWVMVGKDTARWLFLTVHIGCATAVLLLYMREVQSQPSFGRSAEPRYHNFFSQTPFLM